MTDAAKRVSEARKDQKLHHDTVNTFNGDIRTRIRKARNYFKRLCRIKKREWVNEKLQQATTDDIWGFQNWSKGSRNYPSPPISRGVGVPKAVSHQEKCDALRSELYQAPPHLEAEYNPDLHHPQEDDLPFEKITYDEVNEAINGTSASSAPGYSQTNYLTVKWAWRSETGRQYILPLMQKCLEAGYHPKAWRRAIAVALRKPGKPDYSNPRAYRLITLLECLGKILEKIVARRLTFLAGKHDLVPANQFGGRSNSSTTDALLTFTNDVQCAWNHKLVTSALTFDIKGYFDFVNHNRLLVELRRKRIPLAYVQWVASFLSDREAAICIDGKRGEMGHVENGVPQGSPISPILAAFYTAELLEEFQRGTTVQADPNPDKATSVHLIMYVDDGKLYVSSKSLETNVERLKEAHERAETWLRSAGLSPDYGKRELMHYTRRKKDGSPSITFDDKDGTRRVVKPEATVRWLGVYFDRKLRFQKHTTILAARGDNAVSGLTMLANTVRGLSQTHLRHLYLACVSPKILYACPVWWTGHQYQIKPLEKVQRRALRLICAAFRTTPIEALEIEASIPPIKHQVSLHVKRCAIRFNKLSPSSPVIQRLPQPWRKAGDRTTPPPLQPRLNNNSATDRARTTTLLDIAKQTCFAHERINPYLVAPWRRTTSSFGGRITIDACKPETKDKEEKQRLIDSHKEKYKELSRKKENLIIYSDGSMVKKRGFPQVGAAAVGFHGGEEVFTEKMGMGGRAEVYDAEMAGLKMGASKAAKFITNHPEVKNIHFFVDNAAAAEAIFDPKPQPGQLYAARFHQRMAQFLDDDPTHTITIAWCPSHCKIAGNDRADELAKEATQLAWNAPISTSRAFALRRAKASTQTAWARSWQKSPHKGRFAIANRIPPSLNPTKHFIELKDQREVFGRLVQCRTGHAYTGEFRKQFFPEKTTNCECGEDPQTREHIIRECTRYEEQRAKLRAQNRELALPELLGTPKGIAALATFIRESGAFTFTGEKYTPKGPPSFFEEPEPPDIDSEDEESDMGET